MGALNLIGAKSFPALVVRDLTEPAPVAEEVEEEIDEDEVSDSARGGAEGTLIGVAQSGEEIFYDEDEEEYFNIFELRGESPEVYISAEPEVTPESIKSGENIFKNVIGCPKCHGEDNKGLTRKDGDFDWVDEAGRPIPKSADLTNGVFKSGSSPQDIYLIFVTGREGSPMPSFSEKLPSEQDRWDLVHYVRSLFTDDLRRKGVSLLPEEYQE